MALGCDLHSYQRLWSKTVMTPHPEKTPVRPVLVRIPAGTVGCRADGVPLGTAQRTGSFWTPSNPLRGRPALVGCRSEGGGRR